MTPYQKIMRAYNDPRGVRGCRLSADDVMLLGRDDAIETRAQFDGEAQCDRTGHRVNRRSGWCACGEERPHAPITETGETPK